MADLESATRALTAVDTTLRALTPMAAQMTQRITPVKGAVHAMAGDTALGAGAVADMQFAQEASSNVLIYLTDARTKLSRLVAQLRNV